MLYIHTIFMLLHREGRRALRRSIMEGYLSWARPDEACITWRGEHYCCNLECLRDFVAQ